jgi:hypothetical protein
MMADWLDAIPNLGVRGVLGVPARFSAALPGTPAAVAGVAGVLASARGTPGTPPGTPALPCKALNYEDEHAEHQEHCHADLWLARLAQLDPSQPPKRFGPERWPGLVADALWLARAHGQAAAGLGWRASDLFGLHDLPGWGGLAEQLCGARWLALSNTIGHWRGPDGDGWIARKTLRPMHTLWEV